MRQLLSEEMEGVNVDLRLFELWTKNRASYESGVLFDGQKLPEASHTVCTKPIDPRAYAELRPAGFFRALRVNVKRAAIQHVRNMNINLFDMLLHVVTGAFLGGSNGPVSQLSFDCSIKKKKSIIVSCSLSPGHSENARTSNAHL